jgi:flagellar protein FlbD
MVYLTRINRTSLVVNSDLIETIQSTPDTVITLTNGRNYMVLESPDEIIGRVIAFRRRILATPSASVIEMPLSSDPLQMESDNAQ